MIQNRISEATVGILAEVDLFEEIAIVEIIDSWWGCAQMTSPGNILSITD
jgi:hypothetical protein